MCGYPDSLFGESGGNGLKPGYRSLAIAFVVVVGFVVASGSEVVARPLEEAATVVVGEELRLSTTLKIRVTTFINTPITAMTLPNVAVGSGDELGVKESGEGLIRLQNQRRSRPIAMKAKPTYNHLVSMCHL